MPHNFHPSYRPDIDGLRAVSILSVIVFHAFPEVISGGFIGVDIFFIIHHPKRSPDDNRFIS